jgi:lipopolysaccharide/colanic/teichoic acid biosynthesis glycosyltransferase
MQKTMELFSQRLTTIELLSFGKFCEKTRIDEIPQCINILKGEMAVVGPRRTPNFV